MYAYPNNPTIRDPKTRLSFTGYAGRVAGFFLGGDMRTCSIKGCENKHNAKGYCQKHYVRFKKHGDPLYTKRNSNPPEYCTVKDCERKHYALGYCTLHHSRFKRNGNPLIGGRSYEMHGKHGTPEYKIWGGIIQRCSNERDTAYKYYGARGITVCDRWRKSFIAFLKDMGLKPFPSAEIERANNIGNYDPDNCYWTTHEKNCQNRRTTKISLETAKEIRKLYTTGKYYQEELANIYDVHNSTISRIVTNRGWI